MDYTYSHCTATLYYRDWMGRLIMTEPAESDLSTMEIKKALELAQRRQPRIHNVEYKDHG